MHRPAHAATCMRRRTAYRDAASSSGVVTGAWQTKCSQT